MNESVSECWEKGFLWGDADLSFIPALDYQTPKHCFLSFSYVPFLLGLRLWMLECSVRPWGMMGMGAILPWS